MMKVIHCVKLMRPRSCPAAVLPSLIEGRVFLAAAAHAPRDALGCIVWNISVTDDGAETVYFGPLAVAPEAQGKGVGGFLVHAVERLAATLRSTTSPKVRSVRCGSPPARLLLRALNTAPAACAPSTTAPTSSPGTSKRATLKSARSPSLSRSVSREQRT